MQWKCIAGYEMVFSRVPGAEVIYQRALVIELGLATIAFKREVEMPLFYRGQQIGAQRVDFLVENILCVELAVGLLLNFGARSLQHKRVINKISVMIRQTVD